MYYYQHHIGDYRRDTSHLSLLEHGIYRQLLDLYYITEKPLDANALRLISVRTADEKQAAMQILSEFFIKEGDVWIHRRCEDEIVKFHSKSDKASASAKARWNKNNDLQNANALQTQSEGNANHKPITINHKPLTNKYTPPIPAELFAEYHAVRKKKKAPDFTERMFNAIVKESQLAGITVEQAIEECIVRSWITFKADWYSKPSRTTQRQADMEWFVGNPVGLEVLPEKEVK